MGKKTKTGKSRQDKFYKLAKESGYRARSAFKLLQLNRKYEFLQQSRVCVDLCAAPGGWLQVASEHMPISSVIIGIDLVPIKPIRNCITFQEDITSEKCRQLIRKELQTWDADVFLHDGAPNVGKSWIHDAYAQAELTLAAFKLASGFLRKGGWFVTKVFRSKDYTSLMWVFNQLFKKVFATKPQASRLESAEIFVVCQGFLKPDKLDPKFLDPKHVFKDIQDLSKASLNVIHPTKQKKKAEGYDDDDTTLHHKLNVSKFIHEENYLQLLGNTNQIIFDDDIILNHGATTEDIKEFCNDIKVLGRSELRSLISWRKKILKSLTEANISNDGEENGDEDDKDEENENKVDEAIAELKDAEEKLQRKKKKKILKEKRKLRDKMNLNMIIKGDKFETGEDIELFSLKNIKNKEDLDNFEEMSSMDESDEEQIDNKIRYDKEDKSYMELYEDEEDHDEEDNDNLDETSDDDQMDEENEKTGDKENEKTGDDEKKNPLLVNLEDKETITNRKMELWYNKDSFRNLDDDDEYELAQMSKEYESKGGSVLKNASGLNDGRKKVTFTSEHSDSSESSEDELTARKKKKSRKNNDSIPKDKEDVVADACSLSDGRKKVTFISEQSDSSESSEDELTARKKKRSRKNNDSIPKDKEDVVAEKKTYKLNAEELAIGEEMSKSTKRRREIIELSYNRYTYADENLPEWFLEDEKKRVIRSLPITQDQVDFYNKRNQSINTRTIKKVAEAKARKKRKMGKKLEKVRKKAENIGESEDVSEKEKWSQIKQAYKKAGLLSNKKQDVTYVVAKRGAGRKVSRPAGVKGHFKVVDPRMKKDLRKQKINMKKNKNKKK